MAHLNRNQILKAKFPFTDVTIAEWGGDVRIRTLNLNERAAMLGALIKHEKEVDAYTDDQALAKNEQQGLAKVENLDQAVLQLIFSIIDPKSNKAMFTMADYDAFRELSYPTLQRLYGAYLMLNKIEPVADLKKTSG